MHVEQWSTIPKVVSLGHRLLSLYLEYPPLPPFVEYAHPLSTIYSPRSEKNKMHSSTEGLKKILVLERFRLL